MDLPHRNAHLGIGDEPGPSSPHNERRRRLGEAVRRVAHPMEVRVVYVDHTEVAITPLSGHGSQRYLLSLSATTEAVIDPRYDLSPRQREIATLAAAGARAPEIASTLSVHTVRSHLKVIYRVLNVGSRAELGRLWAEFEEQGS